jgi:hypothetical protein
VPYLGICLGMQVRVWCAHAQGTHALTRNRGGGRGWSVACCAAAPTHPCT